MVMHTESHTNYAYKNVHDFCLGRSMPPVKLRSNLELGRRYLVPCVDILTSNSPSEEVIHHEVLNQLENLETLPNRHLKDLLVKISLNTKISCAPSKIESIVLPIFQKLQQWRNKRMLKTSLGVHLSFDLNLQHTPQKDLLSAILPSLNHTAGNGADLLWISFEHKIADYNKTLEASNYSQALQIFHEYYERISMLFLSLISDYTYDTTPLGLNLPQWSLPSTLPAAERTIYAPLLLMIEAKLLSLPTLCSRQNCLLFHTGAGALAKAMTGAPLIAPSQIDPLMNIGNIAMAFADSLSIGLGEPLAVHSLPRFKALKQIVDYFNTLHESGYVSNQETRNVLIKSSREPSPIEYTLQYPHICNTARKLLSVEPGFTGLVDIFVGVLKHLSAGEKEGSLSLTPEELAVLTMCQDQLSTHL